ncbi:MAG: hypothetical protein PHS49_03200 [Candidatus Gracilibacteria bacterium]|nr:hypothetical protein [Candidatus Gracilibacteria bacterium]
MVNYLALENDFDEVKRANFFNYSFVSSLVWMFFHFTVVYFFLIQLKSPLLVGIFLGFGNFISFLFDSPIGVIQKYFSPKKIFLFGTYLMLLVSLIFLYFIYQTSTIEIKVDFSVEALKILLSSAFNIFLLILTVTFYGIIKEIGEVTSFSYIMNKSDPSEYSTLFSKRNIYCGVGSLVGLLISGVILALNILFAVSVLVLSMILFIYFTNKYFDSSENELRFDDLKNIKLITKQDLVDKKDNIVNGLKEYKTTILTSKLDIVEKTKNIKVLFLKPIELKNSIDFKEIYDITLSDMKSFYNMIFVAPYNHRLLVMGAIFTLFGFWDTFVTSFLIDFIDGILVKNSSDLAKFNLQNIFTAYVFIALLAIPAYGAQIPLIKLGDRIGILKVLLGGTLLSGISIFLFGVYDTLAAILFLGLLNSFGYAAGMPLSQGEFSIEYNNTYAEKNNLKQIDSNASSAPIKMIGNLANVLGLITGGILISLFGYSGTFFVFGGIMIATFLVSVIKMKEYKL